MTRDQVEPFDRGRRMPASTLTIQVKVALTVLTKLLQLRHYLGLNEVITILVSLKINVKRLNARAALVVKADGSSNS